MHARRDALVSDITRSNPARSFRLRIGQRCRVDGVLHTYLGPAHLRDVDSPVHVFHRDEWRPYTPDQLPVSLVRERDLLASVTPIQRSFLT
jgi:hypothetical protein